MAYISSAELKTYLGVTLTTDDTLMATLIAAAQQAVDKYTGRVFEYSGADTTRTFDAVEDVFKGNELMFKDDLYSITSIVTNANGTAPITLAASDYFARPRTGPPYHSIVIANSSSYFWTYTNDPQDGITITGKWAYSLTPPADVKLATLRLAGYYFRLKDSQVFDVTSIPEQGVMMIPKGMPMDVKILLDPYIMAVL